MSDLAERLKRTWPHCWYAVAYTEGVVCGTVDEPGYRASAWDEMMAPRPPMTLDEVLECIQQAIEGETACGGARALAETRHPSYRAYLAGKMGMV